MAITTYAELQTAIANFSNRDDLTARIPEFITLCEADMETRLKLLEFESTATVAITLGTGTLPTGFLSMRSAYWDSSRDREISYITPELYDHLRVNDTGDGYYYTISGATIRTMPMGSGSIVCTYSARFAALSGGVNAILTNFPNAYLYGSLLHLAIYVGDDAGAQKYGLLFNSIVDKIVKNDEERRYAGTPLQVRAR